MRGARIANLAIGMAVLIALGGPARAEPKAPTRAEINAARRHFESAEQAKGAGEYRAAAEEYVAAYEILPDAEFLFNAGEMYRLAGDSESAIHYFQSYLDHDPDGRGADQARKALETLRPAEPDPEPTVTPAIVVNTPPATITAGPERPANPGKTLRIAGMSAAGAGVVVLGAGIYFGLKAKSISDEASDWQRYMPDRVAEGESAETWAVIGTSVGAAALVGGGVLYYLGMQKEYAFDTELAQITPLVTPTTRGVQVAGRF